MRTNDVVVVKNPKQEGYNVDELRGTIVHTMLHSRYPYLVRFITPPYSGEFKRFAKTHLEVYHE